MKLRTRWNHISNDGDIIKSCGKFEEHRQFLDGVGIEFLVAAIESTITEIIESGETIEESKSGGIRLFDKIITDHKLTLFPNISNTKSTTENNTATTRSTATPSTSTTSSPTEPNQSHFDDMAKYGSDFASRTLLSLVMRRAERDGDFDVILALKIVLVSFFFNASSLNSQYAQTLMFDIVDYFSASSATRRRLEAMVTANLSGKAGHNIHVDKMCEQFIRQVKEILRGLHRGFREGLVAVSIAASNSIRFVFQQLMLPLLLYHHHNAARRKSAAVFSALVPSL